MTTSDPNPADPYASPPSTGDDSSGDDSTPDARPTWVRYQVLLMLCLAATIAYVSRNSISVAESTIRNDLGISKEDSGWIMGSFFFTYALLQIPTGWLANRWGSRRAISMFSVLWSAATGLMGLAVGWPVLLASRLLNGAAQAGLFPSCTNTISKWMGRRRQALATGSLASFMSAGGAIGISVTGILIGEGMVFSVGGYQWGFAGGMDWRTVFLIYSLPGVIWAAWFYFWFRDRPEDHAKVNRAELREIRSNAVLPASSASDSKPEPTPWVAMFTSPALWWICAQQFCRAAAYMFFTSWFATYLQEAKKVEVTASGFLNMLPLLAVVVGGVSGGAFSDWVLKCTGSIRWARQGVAAATMFSCAALIFWAYFIEDPLMSVLVISTGSFFAAVGGPCAYTITIDMGGRHVATTHATMNMCGNFGAFVFPIVVPWVLKLTGSWDAVMLMFAGTYVAAGIFWLLLRPVGTIFEQALIDRPKREDSHDPR